MREFLTLEDLEALQSRTLVLLSKQYRRALPRVEGRTDAQPSMSIRMDKFDYANPEG